MEGMNSARGENVKCQPLLLFIATEFRRSSLNSPCFTFAVKGIQSTAR